MNATIKVLAALLTVAAVALAGYAIRIATVPAPAPVAARPAAATYPVVVTTRAVMAGQRLESADLRVERFPLPTAGAHAEPGGLVGKRTTIDLGAGVPVLDALTASGLSTRVPSGERAVAVRVDEAVGIGHRVRPGDLVDLFLLLKQNGAEVGYTQSRLLLPSVRILGYGSDSVDGPMLADAPARDGNARREAPRVAIVSVALDHVNHLLLGASNGSLVMALRNPEDREQPAPALVALPTALPLPKPSEGQPPAADLAAAGLRLETLSTRGGAPRPRAAPAERAVNTEAARVEVIRPGRRDSVSY